MRTPSQSLIRRAGKAVVGAVLVVVGFMTIEIGLGIVLIPVGFGLIVSAIFGGG